MNEKEGKKEGEAANKVDNEIEGEGQASGQSSGSDDEEQLFGAHGGVDSDPEITAALEQAQKERTEARAALRKEKKLKLLAKLQKETQATVAKTKLCSEKRQAISIEMQQVHKQVQKSKVKQKDKSADKTDKNGGGQKGKKSKKTQPESDRENDSEDDSNESTSG